MIDAHNMLPHEPIHMSKT